MRAFSLNSEEEIRPAQGAESALLALDTETRKQPPGGTGPRSLDGVGGRRESAGPGREEARRWAAAQQKGRGRSAGSRLAMAGKPHLAARELPHGWPTGEVMDFCLRGHQVTQDPLFGSGGSFVLPFPRWHSVELRARLGAVQVSWSPAQRELQWRVQCFN